MREMTAVFIALKTPRARTGLGKEGPPAPSLSFRGMVLAACFAGCAAFWISIAWAIVHYWPRHAG